MRLSDDEETATCLYRDNSILVWNVADPHRISRLRSLLGHSGHVTDVQARLVLWWHAVTGGKGFPLQAAARRF